MPFMMSDETGHEMMDREARRIADLLGVLKARYPRSRALWDQAYRAALADDENALRDCLGRWVSELEPVAVYDESSTFLGLAVADVPGRVSIIVPRGDK